MVSKWGDLRGLSFETNNGGLWQKASFDHIMTTRAGLLHVIGLSLGCCMLQQY